MKIMYILIAIVWLPWSSISLGATPLQIDIWHGDRQRVGHLGEAQPDFNVLGNIKNEAGVERLFWWLNGRGGSPMHFHAFRRLVSDGDFNADIPISWMDHGANTITITATLSSGEEVSKSLTVVRTKGRSRLPFRIDWSEIDDPQEVGQYVDGKWRLTEVGLRTDQIGYDRIFLVGENDWRDYEVQTSVTIHAVEEKTTPLSGGAGVGWILRFAGHAVGGPRNFPAAQPKWGYQPFGAISWLRWPSHQSDSPALQFYPGVSDGYINYGNFSYTLEQPYSVRLKCETLPDAVDGSGVTRYSFKIWEMGEAEPNDWTWSHLQTDLDARRSGGVALVAHHVDATFGKMEVTNP